MLFQFLYECGRLRQEICHTRVRHHRVWSSEPEAPSNGSWILLVEDLVTVAIANEELSAIFFGLADRVWGHGGRSHDQQATGSLEHHTLGIILKILEKNSAVRSDAYAESASEAHHANLLVSRPRDVSVKCSAVRLKSLISSASI